MIRQRTRGPRSRSTAFAVAMFSADSSTNVTSSQRDDRVLTPDRGMSELGHPTVCRAVPTVGCDASAAVAGARPRVSDGVVRRAPGRAQRARAAPQLTESARTPLAPTGGPKGTPAGSLGRTVGCPHCQPAAETPQQARSSTNGGQAPRLTDSAVSATSVGICCIPRGRVERLLHPSRSLVAGPRTCGTGPRLAPSHDCPCEDWIPELKAAYNLRLVGE